MSADLRLSVWNVEWAERSSRRGAAILDALAATTPDILCITEGYLDFLPNDGHLIASEADYGYPLQEGRRKVLL